MDGKFDEWDGPIGPLWVQYQEEMRRNRRRKSCATAGKPDVVLALLAVEFAALAAAGTLGWDWGHFSNVTQDAQQRFGAAWWQPFGGQQACWEHWGALRPLYQRGGNGTWARPRPERGWRLGGSAQRPSTAELLESGALGGWVQHLAAAAYEESSAADVALVAGQLAVLPGSRAVAWALPANITLQEESAVWSPPFALGDTLWRLVALSRGPVVHLGALPDRPLNRSAQLRVSAAGSANVYRPTLGQPSGLAPGCTPPFFIPENAPWFQLAWMSPVPGTMRNGPAGEHQHRDLPGCWLLPAAYWQMAAARPQPWWERAGVGNKQREREDSWETLISVQLELRRPGGGGSALPAAPASPLLAVPAGGGAAALFESSRYARLLSQQQQVEWRLPPAAPGFNSSLLRLPELPPLVDAILAVSSSSSRACPLPGGGGGMEPPGVASALDHLGALMAQAVPPLDEAAMQQARMALGSPVSTSGWRRWYAALKSGLNRSVGSWIEEGLAQLLRALLSRPARALAALALVLLLVQQGVLACQLAAAALRHAQHARQGSASDAAPAAPQAPALLPRIVGLPRASLRRALRLSARLKDWNPLRLTIILLSLTVTWNYSLWPVGMMCLLSAVVPEAEATEEDALLCVHAFLARLGSLLFLTTASDVISFFEVIGSAAAGPAEADRGYWAQLMDFLFGPNMRMLIAGPLSGLADAYDAPFNPVARRFFQTLAADYLQVQLWLRAFCALGLQDCTHTFGCTGPAALLPGRGPLLLALAPLFRGVWVSICAADMDVPPDDATAQAWQQRAYRFATTLWPFEIVHALLWRATHTSQPGAPRLLRRADTQPSPDGGTDGDVPLLCQPLEETSWWQRLLLAYMDSPKTARELGRLASARRLLPSAWQALTLRRLVECSFIAVVTIPLRLLVWSLYGLAAWLGSLPGLVTAAISLPLRLFFGPLSQRW
ncbi:hypothetical protein COHA_008734 [Chlorella ohadii]|uniref:Uncharacterized protein n=1 Tax=Chlorella ohadii TaxID=2649997 RepID=A0AAD5DG57_9CHLO|nr:hypothetical protein COHA_008734 [Chlorella ohadii]